MPESILFYTQFSPGQMFYVLVCCFIAGVARGFSGFALSALIMASLVVILPPVQLLPICYVMELMAGLMMSRDGFKHADYAAVAWLVAGSVIGVPIGTYATVHMPVELSKILVLGIIIVLAIAQLFIKLPKAHSGKVFIVATGIIAGIATGLAHVGGMLIALYILAKQLSPTTTRATLILFLLAGSVTTGISLFYFDIFSPTSIWRSLLLAPAVAGGVLLGSWLFNPKWQPYYRRVCLLLLIGVSISSLLGSLA